MNLLIILCINLMNYNICLVVLYIECYFSYITLFFIYHLLLRVELWSELSRSPIFRSYDLLRRKRVGSWGGSDFVRIGAIRRFMGWIGRSKGLHDPWLGQNKTETPTQINLETLIWKLRTLISKHVQLATSPPLVPLFASLHHCSHTCFASIHLRHCSTPPIDDNENEDHLEKEDDYPMINVNDFLG